MREDQLSTRPTIELRSPNSIPQWWIAVWAVSILALGTLAAMTIIIPDAFERVRVAEAKT